MINAAVTLAAVASGLGTLWYIWLVIRNRVQPLLTSWIIFATTMTIGLWSYWNSPEHSLSGNIGNLVGVASTGSILLVVVIFQLFRDGPTAKFSDFQIKCLVATSGILGLWAILRFVIGNEIAATISNVLTQCLMVVGYVALAERLWKADKKTESIFFWSMMFLASAFSLIPAIMKSDWLGLVYGGRSTLTSATTIYLVFRIVAKAKQQT